MPPRRESLRVRPALSRRMTSRSLETILADARGGRAPSPEDARFLLSLPERSFEARLLMATADELSRRRFGNQGLIFGQIGIETAPCAADCGFCSFSEKLGRAGHERLTLDDIRARARAFATGGDLFALFLMTMHDYDFGFLSEAISEVRAVVSRETRLVVNIGDFGPQRARQLRELGVSGAYHVLRLGEGVDTVLRPEARVRTLRTIRDSGLDLYTCCEPVGPEHSPAELVEQILAGLEHAPYQHAAMRRVHIPGGPLADRGQVTNLRLAQVTAVVFLMTLESPSVTNVAVHEPNLLGLTAGANAIYAESGANPRDGGASAQSVRGLDVAGARRMLRDAGFTALRCGDGSAAPLVLDEDGAVAGAQNVA